MLLFLRTALYLLAAGSLLAQTPGASLQVSGPGERPRFPDDDYSAKP